MKKQKLTNNCGTCRLGANGCCPFRQYDDEQKGYLCPMLAPSFDDWKRRELQELDYDYSLNEVASIARARKPFNN